MSGKMFVCGIRSFLTAGCAAIALTAVADSSNPSWQYVSPVPDEWLATIDKTQQYNATGVITNGDFRLIVRRETGSSNLSLGTYSGGWGPTQNTAFLCGSGSMDLSKPIYVEGTDERLTLTRTYMRCFRVANATVTEMIFPKELETIGDYLFLGVNFSALTNVVLDCPVLTTIGSGAFHNCTNVRRLYLKSDELTAIKGSRNEGYTFIGNRTTPLVDALTIKTAQPIDLGFVAWYMSFKNVSVNDISFDLARTVGRESFNTGGGGKTGFTEALRLPIVEKVETSAFSMNQFGSIEVGYTNLQEIADSAFSSNDGFTNIVIGVGSASVKIGTSAFQRSWAGSKPYRVFFRGEKPDFSGVAADGWAFDDQSGDRTSRFYIPYGDASWNDVVAAATPCAQEEFNAKFPDDDSTVIGTIPSRAVGQRGVQYLCYDDYRRYESDLFVTGAVGEYGEVTPAYGVHRQYKAGDVIPLAASAEVIDIGGMKVRATKYVVETIDKLGRWGNTVTNDYVGGSSSVILPADGCSVRVTWLFERQMRVSLAALMTADYPDEEVTSSVALDADGCAFVAEGGTVTLTASSKSEGLPRTRFVRWDGDIGEADATAAKLTLTMDQARHVRAVFSHGWNLTSNTRITDGVWTLAVSKLSDGPDGEKRLKLGSNWYTAYVDYTGTLGAIDLSAPIEDAFGNSYVITFIETCALRADNTSQYVPDNAIIKDLTLPTALQTIGSYIAMGNTALTNLTVICPRLEKINDGLASNCSALQHAELVCTNLVDMTDSKDYAPFWRCYKLRKLNVRLPRLGRLPKYFAVGNLGDSDATEWDLSSVTNVAAYAFDMAVCGGYEGPYGTLSLPALEMLEGERQFLCCSKLTGLRLGSGKLRHLGDYANCTAGMKSLKCVELGLAAENDIGTEVFNRWSDSCPAAHLTNVTFTAAPPTSANLFTALAATHAAPEDGTKTLTYVADFAQPGWTDAYLSEMDIDTQATDAEAAELSKLPRKERRWFRGVVWTPKRYAWLFDMPRKHGLMMIVK